MEPFASDNDHGQLDRRRLLRTGVVIGSLAWATPVVQTVASPAFAAGSPLCETRVEVDDCTLTYLPTVDCCECVEEHPELSLADALALCVQEERCVEDLEICGEDEETPPPDDGNPPPDDGNPPPDLEVEGRQAGVPTVIPAGA